MVTSSPMMMPQDVLWDSARVQRLDGREVYRSAWMTVREDTVARADGSTGQFGVVDKSDFALVMPAEKDGFWLVEQFRYPIRRRSWEFPQGSWPAGSSATGSPEDLARAELAEETGLRAGSIRRLGFLHEAPGFCSQGFTVWLATDLRPGPTSREPSESDMQQRWVPADALDDMIHTGHVIDAATIAAYMLLQIDQRRR